MNLMVKQNVKSNQYHSNISNKLIFKILRESQYIM